jgi:hypothetical protein
MHSVCSWLSSLPVVRISSRGLGLSDREQFYNGQRISRSTYREFELPSTPADGTEADWDAWIVACCALLEGEYTLETVSGTTKRLHLLSATSDLLPVVTYDVDTLKFSKDPQGWFRANVGTAPSNTQ